MEKQQNFKIQVEIKIKVIYLWNMCDFIVQNTGKILYDHLSKRDKWI